MFFIVETLKHEAYKLSLRLIKVQKGKIEVFFINKVFIKSVFKHPLFGKLIIQDILWLFNFAVAVGWLIRDLDGFIHFFVGLLAVG